MPPKVFKAPDGKEFTSKSEWRDYMIATFYSFSKKVDEPTPLIKNPGDVGGQSFDISDCSNSTLVVMDHCEQVQLDMLSNCRVFIGASASSIFIRNCANCTFYTCCRQLRLRDVTDSIFYIHSMSEVHIEDTTKVLFAPFNGGYPEHAEHLRNANIDLTQNLWYDIFDHNDPDKTHKNWALLEEIKYEQPWFPQGTPCPIAVTRTQVGSLEKVQDTNMQSFNIQPSRPPPAVVPATAATTTASPTTVTATVQPPILPSTASTTTAIVPPPTQNTTTDNVIFVKMVPKPTRV